MIIIIDPELSLKGFLDFILIWSILCYKNILIDTGGGVMNYIDRLVLGGLLVMFISLSWLEIICIIKTEVTMEKVEMLLWRGDINEYQCDLITFNSNTLAPNLGGLNLRYLLFNGWSYLIGMVKSLTIVSESTTIDLKYYVM